MPESLITLLMISSLEINSIVLEKHDSYAVIKNINNDKISRIIGIYIDLFVIRN
jgi:hypothetical protein